MIFTWHDDKMQTDVLIKLVPNISKDVLSSPIMASYSCTHPSVDRSVLEMICSPWEKEIYFDEQSKEVPLGWVGQVEIHVPPIWAPTERPSFHSSLQQCVSRFWAQFIVLGSSHSIRSLLSFFIHLQHQSYLRWLKMIICTWKATARLPTSNLYEKSTQPDKSILNQPTSHQIVDISKKFRL